MAFVAVAAAVAAVAVQPEAAPAASQRGRRHMHSCCQFLEVLDTGVKQQLDKLVSKGDALLGEEVSSCFLDATQHKLGLELSHLTCSVKPCTAKGSQYIGSNNGELW